MYSPSHFSSMPLISLFLAFFLYLQNYPVIGSPTPLFAGDILVRNYDSLTTNLEPRALEAAGPPLEPRHLSKRQCVLSTEKNKNGNFKWKCDGQVVSLSMIHDNINSKGYATGRVTMFYTKLGGANGVKQSKCWANNHPDWIPPKADGADKAGYVMFDQVCDAKWSAAVVQDYNRNKENLKFDGDQFQKCKSQALAEQASGDVYLFIPKGIDANPGSAWVGWEFPALKRNDNVENVWRVDPTDPGNTDRENIWKKGGDKGPDPKCKVDGNPA